MAATLKQVATLAAVSTATASLALNGGPVNEKTRQRVLECAAQLNYVPSALGRSLTTGTTRTIQFVILTSNLYTDTVRRTSLFYYILEGIMSVAAQNGFGLRFDVKSHDDPTLGRYFESTAGSGAVDGLAIIPQFLRDFGFMETIRRQKFPYILLRPERFGPADNYVDMGNYDGGQIVANLFLKAGTQRTAIINGPELHFDSIERERGFVDGLMRAMPTRLDRVYGDFTIESGYDRMTELLEKGVPDSLFCANDYMAAGAIKRLTEVGLRVPDDVSVVGYDNNDIGIATAPALTTVDNHFFDLGVAMGEELLLQVRGKSSAHRQVAPRLVARASHRSRKKRR